MALRILVIDDEPDWREQFQDLLEIMEFDVDTAEGEEDAKALLRRGRYALVLLDLCLDQLGFTPTCQDFYRFLRHQYPDLPLVVVTGKILEPTAVLIVSELGAADFIRKDRIEWPSFWDRIEAALHPFQYDVFVSYSHHDKDWVQGTLLPILRAAGARVCVDFRDFEPGAPTLTEMERAVLQSRKTLLVLTPAYLASEWAEFENILGQTLDPAARQRRLLPLLLEPCELPLRISNLTHLDFTEPEQQGIHLDRLIAAIMS